MNVPARAHHFEAAGAHRRQVGAARDEGHIGPGLRQRRPVRSADAAGADYRDPHGVIPCPGLRRERLGPPTQPSGHYADRRPA